MNFRKTAIAAILTAGLAGVSGQASAHSYYNLSGTGTTASGDAAVGFGILNSINGTDGVSNNSNGAASNKVSNGTTVYNATTNNYISGTGSAASSTTELSGNLPYMWYSGQHTYASFSAPGATSVWTKREIYTGSSVTDNTGNLYAATVSNGMVTPGGIGLGFTSANFGANNLTSEWNAYNAKNTGGNAATWGTVMADLPASGDHPYIAVAGDSASTGLGLDYGLIHISCGTNTAANNCATYGDILTTITITQDSDYLTNNTATNALLDVALYRGADTSSASDRTAAADLTGTGPSNIQGSDLGAAIWSGHATAIGDILSFSFIFNQAEWDATDSNSDLSHGSAHTNGFYTLVVGAHGGLSTNGVVYDTMVTTSPAAVPVPGAVWLFGSAMAGLIGFGRRKAVVQA